MTDSDTTPPIGWLRAAITTAIIAVVAIALLVYVPNAVLTKWSGRTRSSLVALATTLFFVFLFASALVLRRLQRRKII
jgi:Kef-type K+ transport system membrane component KefB